MVSNPRFIDLDHLVHRLLVTHRVLLHSRRSRQSRKCERFARPREALPDIVYCSGREAEHIEITLDAGNPPDPNALRAVFVLVLEERFETVDLHDLRD
jgi:hypothetical protein